MKQKKMHFSLRLLWEGFQQCKMIGIFSAVIVVLGAVLEPVAQAISLGSSPHYTKVVYEAWGINAACGAAGGTADDTDAVPLSG